MRGAEKKTDPGVAQLVARVVWDHQAAGSNPVTRTKYKGDPAGASLAFGMGDRVRIMSAHAGGIASLRCRWQKQ